VIGTRGKLFALLFALLALPPVVSALEARLWTHLLIQLPLLVVAGFALGADLRVRGTFVRTWLAAVPAGPLVALAISLGLYWMLPRSMDAALESAPRDVLKFLSVTFGVGVPLGLGWARLSSVSRGFLLGNLLSMLVVLGWLYTSAPVRVCNFYLEGDQALTGQCFYALAACLAAWWALRCFLPRAPEVQVSRAALTPPLRAGALPELFG